MCEIIHGRESYRFIFQEHSFGKEVNPNCGLLSKTDTTNIHMQTISLVGAYQRDTHADVRLGEGGVVS